MAVSRDEMEIAKLQSEIQRNEVEKQKFLKEVEEFELRAKKSTLSIKGLLQALIAGAIAAALISAWAIEYLKPILERNNELAAIENKVLLFKTKRQRQRNEVETIALTRDIDEARKLLQETVQQNNEQRALNEIQSDQTRKQLQEMVQQNNETITRLDEAKALIIGLQVKIRKLSVEYRTLAADRKTTQDRRDTYQKLADRAQEDVASLQLKLEKLQVANEQSEVLEASLADRIATQGLVGTRWSIQEYDGSSRTFDHVLRPGGVLEYIYARATKNNTWSISRSVITMTHNNAYATFKGRLQDDGSMDGTASNKVGLKWKWAARLQSP